MNRRLFLTTLVMSIAYSHTASSSLIPGPSVLLSPKSLPLKTGDVILAKSNMRLSLPENPKNGDNVRIIVDNTSLNQPCVIDYHNVSIAGDNEPLVLNSMANFKLVYKADTRNWILA